MDPWTRKISTTRRFILRLVLFSTLLTISFTAWLYLKYPREKPVDVDPFAKCSEAIAELGVPSLEDLLRLDHSTTFLSEGVSVGNFSTRMRTISASELMEKGESPAPWILHQSWKDGPLPDHFQRWSESWKGLFDDTWVYVLWRDADNRKLVEKYYPSYLEEYDALSREIYRADMIRNMYMHQFGGIYADLDMIVLRGLPDALPFPSHGTSDPVSMAYLGHMGHDTHEHSIPNAFMASSAPGHPFWLLPLEYVKAHQMDEEYKQQPEFLTGPVALRACVKEWQKGSGKRLDAGEFAEVTVLPNDKIYPFSWYDSPLAHQCLCRTHSGHFSEPRCYWLFPTSWTITHWTHSWGFS